MDWEFIGAISEAVGAIVVIATIFYLAVQIKQNTKAVKASSHHAVTDSFNSINALIIQDPKVGRLWRLGNEGLSNLTEDEGTSYFFLALAYMRIIETLFYQRKIGVMEEQLYLSEENSVRWWVIQPGFLEWWENNPISFSEEFRRHVALLIKEGKG